MNSHRLQALSLDDLEYAKGRIAMYNELPTKALLLTFIFEVEARIEALEIATNEYCYGCGGSMKDEEDE